MDPSGAFSAPRNPDSRSSCAIDDANFVGASFDAAAKAPAVVSIEPDSIPDSNFSNSVSAAAPHSKIVAQAKSAAAAEAETVSGDLLFAKLRKIAFSVSSFPMGISVRALSDYTAHIDNQCSQYDSKSIMETVSSNEVGPAELYVIHDSTALFSVTLASLVSLVSAMPNALETFVWIDVACLPLRVRKTRSLLQEIRQTMSKIGRVILVTDSFPYFRIIKQAWCLYQIQVAFSLGCRLMFSSIDALGFQALLCDDSAWDKMLSQINFANSEFSGDDSEKVELLRDCGVNVSSVFDSRIRLALDKWYIEELSTVLNLDANEKKAEGLSSTVSRLQILSRVHINRKHLSKARPLCVEYYRCAKHLLNEFNVSSFAQTSNSNYPGPADDSAPAPADDFTPAPAPAPAPAYSSAALTSIQELVYEAASYLLQVFDGLKEFNLARPLHHEILDMLVQLYGDEHQHTLNARYRFASHLQMSGSFDSALEVAELVLRVRELSSQTSLEVASSAELLGLIYEDLHQLDRALSCHQRALDIRRQHLTAHHEDTWSSMHFTAQILLLQGATLQAQVLFREVYDSTITVLGEYHFVTLMAAEKLAKCLSETQDSLAEVLTIYLKILHCRRSMMSIDNSEVVTSLFNVAVSYCRLGKHREGLDTYELAISTSQKVYGIKHVSTLNLQKQAAAICIQLGFDTKALVLLEGAFENSVDTQNFFQISDTMLCVVAHCHLGNYDVALDIVDCAFLKYESRNHLEDLMELHYQRGQVLSLQNRWLDAKAELASCLSLNRMTRTAPPVVWDAAIALATATSHCGDVLAGLDILREAYAMCITARGAHDVITLSTEHSLARFLWEHFDSTSAQRRDAEAVITRNIEAKRLIFGVNHSSTIRSMQLMCQIFSQSDRHAFESALLDLLSSCQRFFGWLHVETQDALNQLAGFFYEMFEMKIAELLYCVGLCLLDCMSSTQTEFLASKTLSALVKLYHTTAQADKMAVLLEFMRLRGHLDKDLPPHFISRNFFIEILQDSMHPQTITQFLHERISDLKHIVSSNHASYPLVRLSEAILTRNVGQFDRARALFSSCMCEMGNCWWDHPDCSFVVTSLASAMIALSDFESSSDLLFNASAYLSNRDPHVSIHILLSAADMYQSASKNDLAARCLQRVVLLQSSHFGPVSSSALSSQRLLADLYIASREFHLAESVMWDALESCLADQSYPSTTEWLEDLCNLYLCLNNVPKALFMAEEALNTCMVVFGGVHTRTLAALERYARLLRTSGQLFLSRDYFEECLQRRIETQGNDAASTNVTRAALADVQMLLQPLMQEQKTASSVLQICDLEADASEALQANDVVSAIQSLAAAFEIAKDTFGSDSMPAARVAVSYGSILLLSEQYQMSILLLRQAVEVLQQNLGRCSKETLVSRAALARALVGKGDLNHAEDILLNCLDQCESSFGLSDRFSMNFVLQLGRLYSMTDCKLQTSRELLQECFWHESVELQDLRGSSKNLCSASFDSMESEFFEILDDLVNVLVRLDDPESAELLLQQAFESHIELYGSSHASSLELISRLANFFVSFIKPQKALPLLRHLLDTKMSVCDFRSTLRAAEDLACVYETMSESNVAEMLLSFCVTHHRAARKFSPSDFSSCLWRYALVLQKSGKFESALLCFLECLECGSSVFDSQDCVSAAENAGICMMKMGLWRCARLMFSYCVEVLTISKVATESIVNQHMCFCLSNLGIVAACDGDLCDAKKLFMACISLNSTKGLSGDAVELELAECSRNLAIVCQKSGNFSESESFFLKCIEVCEQCKDFSKSLDAQYSLALLRWDIGSLTKAEEVLLQLLSDAKRQFGELNPNFIALNQELAVFFQESGNPLAALSLHQCSLNLTSSIGMHESTLNSQLGLAHVFKSLGMTEKALESSRNCARDGMLLLGPNHPLTLESLSFLRLYTDTATSDLFG